MHTRTNAARHEGRCEAVDAPGPVGGDTSWSHMAPLDIFIAGELLQFVANPPMLATMRLATEAVRPPRDCAHHAQRSNGFFAARPRLGAPFRLDFRN